jgi:hypothetical protein
MVTSWAGPPAMLNIFRKMYGSHSCPAIIRQNNFTHFQHYFLLKVSHVNWNIRVIAWLFQMNRISGVMVSVLDSSTVVRGFEPPMGQTKDYKIGICCFSAKHAAFRRKSSCNNVAPVTNLCLGRATTWSHSSQWSKKKVAVET